MNGTRTDHPSTATSPDDVLHTLDHWGQSIHVCSCGAAYLEGVNAEFMASYGAWLQHLDRMAEGVPEHIRTEAEVYREKNGAKVKAAGE